MSLTRWFLSAFPAALLMVISAATLAQTPTVVLTATDATAAELGAGTATFTVTRSGASLANPLSVSFTLAGTATHGSDYSFIGSSVTIAATQAAVTLTVTPIADNLVEGNETLVMTLVASAGYVFGSPGSATATIIDDPALVTLAAGDNTATELGLTTGTFTVTRSGGDIGSELSLSVDRGGNAVNGSDYAFAPNSLGIPAGQLSVTQPVTPFADNLVEGAETVTLALLATSSYLIGTPASGVITIADNPAIVNLWVTDASAAEVGLDPGMFRFTRSGGDIGSELSISLNRTGSAINGSDYAFTSNSFSIPAGQLSATQPVTPFADNLVEGNETVTLNLLDGSNFVIGTPGNFTVTIADNAPVVTLIATDSLADEFQLNPGTFTFTRSGGDLGVELSIGISRGGTAVNGADYGFVSNSIGIPAGQTAATQIITPFADNSVEGDETVTATLAGSSTYLIGTPGISSVTIADDPALLTITALDPIAKERDAEPGSYLLTRGGGDLATALSASLTLSGNATHGIDFEFISSAVSLPANASSTIVPLTPIFDLIIEGNETVTLTLEPSASYLIEAPQSATVTIVDFIDAVFSDQFE